MGLFKNKAETKTESIFGGEISDETLKINDRKADKVTSAKAALKEKAFVGEQLQEKKKTGKSLIVICCSMVLVVALLLVVGFFWTPLVTFVTGTDPEAKNERDGSGHFYDSETVPDLSDEGIKGAVTEAYYTKDGSLAVMLNLSNGMTADQHLKTVSVTITDDSEKIIAAGKVEQVPADFKVDKGSYNNLLVYISKEYVKIADNDLSSIKYTITTECTPAS